MRSIAANVWAVLSLGVVSACARSEPPAAALAIDSPTSSGAIAPPADAGVVGHFETREHRVTWLSTSDGPLFTVRTNDGSLLASDMTVTEVGERFPALRDFTRGFAATPDGTTLDASTPIFDASVGYDGRR